jgi:hypothetical protein
MHSVKKYYNNTTMRQLIYEVHAHKIKIAGVIYRKWEILLATKITTKRKGK